MKKITIPETSNQDELNSTMIVLKQLMKLLITLEEEEQSKLLSNLKEPIEFLEINKKGKLDLKQKYLTIPLQISENELRSILF